MQSEQSSMINSDSLRTTIYLQIPAFSNAIQISSKEPELESRLIFSSQNDDSISIKKQPAAQKQRHASFRMNAFNQQSISYPLDNLSYSFFSPSKILNKETPILRFKRISKKQSSPQKKLVVNNSQNTIKIASYKSNQILPLQQKNTLSSNNCAAFPPNCEETPFLTSNNQINADIEEENIYNKGTRFSISTPNSFESSYLKLVQIDQSYESPKDRRVIPSNDINFQPSFQILCFEEEYETLKKEYKEIPKNNTLKNIKNAFIRFIQSSQNQQFLEYKCNTMQLDLKQIQINVGKSIKNDHQHNKNIRYLLKNEIVSPLFKDFLMNAQSYWFDRSALHCQKNCKQMVSLLLKMTQHDQYINIIQQYEKIQQ